MIILAEICLNLRDAASDLSNHRLRQHHVLHIPLKVLSLLERLRAQAVAVLRVQHLPIDELLLFITLYEGVILSCCVLVLTHYHDRNQTGCWSLIWILRNEHVLLSGNNVILGSEGSANLVRSEIVTTSDPKSIALVFYFISTHCAYYLGDAIVVAG